MQHVGSYGFLQLRNGHEILVSKKKEKEGEGRNGKDRVQPRERAARRPNISRFDGRNRCFGQNLLAGSDEFRSETQLSGAFGAREIMLLVSLAQLRREFAEQVFFTSLRIHRRIMIHPVSVHIAN